MFEEDLSEYAWNIRNALMKDERLHIRIQKIYFNMRCKQWFQLIFKKAIQYLSHNQEYFSEMFTKIKF